MKLINIILFIILFIILCLLALIISNNYNNFNSKQTRMQQKQTRMQRKQKQGGIEYVKNDIVIDTLNLVSFLMNGPANTQEKIIAGISYAIPILKQKYPGRLMFVLKDANSRFNTSEIRDSYKELAHKFKIYMPN